MKKRIITIPILFIFLALSYQSQAQVYGKIDYGIKMIFNPLDSLDPNVPQPPKASTAAFKKIIDESTYLLSKLNYILEFNNKQALFYKKDKMVSDSNHNKLSYLLTLSNSEETYYSDFSSDSSKVYKQAELGGNYYLKREKNHNWQLSNETKEIAGYLCKKATIQKKEDPYLSMTITAWYCPDLPYNYGPKKFSGLPGMILGLEERGFYYYAKEISIKNKNHNIKKPKGEIIEEKDYSLLVKKFYEQFTD